LDHYKKNLEKIEIILNELNDKNSFTNNVLGEIRNRIAFHFDKGIIKEAIEQFVDGSLKEKKDVVLMSGKSVLSNINV